MRKSLKQGTNNKIGFLIPIYKDNPNDLIKLIRKTFVNPYILIVNDGYVGKINGRGIKIICNSHNFGLANSLVLGFSHLIKKDLGYIVRIDPDMEYPIQPVKGIIRTIEKSNVIVGAFVQLKRTTQSNGFIDAIFHNTMGILEGVLVLGKPMIQHSPGLQIYKRSVISTILPNLIKVTKFHNLTWGLDLVILKMACKQGKVIDFSIYSHLWRERRSIRKIYYQTICSLNIMFILVAEEIKSLCNNFYSEIFQISPVKYL